MCGRIACSLGVDDLRCATACKSKESDVFVKTEVHKSTLGYQPSFNVPPTASVPVLVHAKHTCFDENVLDSYHLLVCMRFGIIPPWQKSENVKSTSSYETHLCKIERLRESKLYNPLFEKRYRCAIPCIGYFEWQSTKGENKQPYFFYNKNNSKDDLKTNECSFDDRRGWTGLKLLYLAGIFSKYQNSDDKEAFSFAIITTETSEEWKHVHHRMPIVLQTDQHVYDWINPTNAPSSVFEILKVPINNLAAHPVNKTVVNKTKNNMVACILPIEMSKPKNTLMSWLNGNKNDASQSSLRKRESLDISVSSSQKKFKKE